jgi:endonuclease YncB( thermonuclease family)
MGASIVKWDAGMAAARLGNRRRWRAVVWGITGVLLFSSLFDHLRAQNRLGDDWHRFDGKQALFVGAIDGQTIAVRDGMGDMLTRVRLLGVASFNPHWDAAAKDRLDLLLAGQAVVLHLEPTQTRDEQKDLLAYVLREDGTPASAQIVREGLALADRRVKFAFDGAVDTAESLARRKRAGLWATADGAEMPRWRSQWFAEKLHQYSQELH